MYLRQALATGAAALGLMLMAGHLAIVPAHQGRGKVVHESTTATPALGYEAPAPETLGGSYELTDHTGRTVTDETFRGRWVLMFFGFAGCREACPVALDRMSLALDELGALADGIEPIFVDLDFAGPDLRGLAQFVGHFHPRLRGLTGPRKEMFSILRKFQVRREIKHGLYGSKETGPRIDHTTYFFLIDPAGKTRAYFYHTLSPAEMAAHIRHHLQPVPVAQ
ncbi:MAG: SCO family protein [Hyphomicrobiaceae bacterium]|nr:SCO family protein [Hyphomicrobiaceae bacterium]